jgi:PA domain
MIAAEESIAVKGRKVMIWNLIERGSVSFFLIALTLAMTSFAPGIQAAESDVWTTLNEPGPTALGSQFTITVGYGNGGPDTATSAYVNSWFTAPMGMDVFIDDFFNGTGAIFEAIQETAVGTDTLGNTPLLFWDDLFCEDLFFQLQGNEPDPPHPVQGLDPGVGATFSYDVTIPMESPNLGVVKILEPASLAQMWTPTNANSLQAAALSAYGRGGCDSVVGVPGIDDVCEFIDDNCFGARVSLLDQPIEADWELVNDGSADPTTGCNGLLGFTPGNIAVIRRGGCEFGDKVSNAQVAGATGAVVVNTAQCSDLPASDQCVFTMGSGALGASVTIPAIMLAMADGEPVIAALVGSETVRGVFGGAERFAANGSVFLSDSSDTDPIPDNDNSQWTQSIYGVGCEYTLSLDHSIFSAAAANGEVALTTTTDCYWEGSTEAPWISFPAGSSGVGSGTLGYQVDANTGGGRAAALRIANQIHYATQTAGNGCTYSIDPTQTVYPETGGTGEITITTQPTCEWAASATIPWVRLTSSATGIGSATITFSVLSTYGGPRTGAVLVADRIHSVTQIVTSLFRDGFETGGTSRWDVTSP